MQARARRIQTAVSAQDIARILSSKEFACVLQAIAALLEAIALSMAAKTLVANAQAGIFADTGLEQLVRALYPGRYLQPLRH